jgi:hypothetical protein
MRNQPERIESVASVAAGLGTPEMKVLNRAGERALIHDWDGRSPSCRATPEGPRPFPRGPSIMTSPERYPVKIG